MKTAIAVLLTTLFLIPLFSSHPLFANEMEIHFASEEWKDATQADGTGLYWDIFRAVFEPEGYKIITRNVSYDGSVRMVEKKAVDAMVGAYEDEFEEGIFPANHFAVDVVQVLYKKKDTMEWHGLKSVENSTVGWVKGYSYDDYLDEAVVKTLKIKRLKDRESLYRLLSAGKIDYWIDAQADITDFFKINAEKYNADDYLRQTLLELKLFVVFRKDKRGEKLAHIFDNNMATLIKSGKLKALYDTYSSGTFIYPSNFLE